MSKYQTGSGEPHNPHNDVKSNAVNEAATTRGDDLLMAENSAVRYHKRRVVETVNEYFLNSDLNWVLGVLSRASSDHLSALIEYGDLTDKDTVKDAVSSIKLLKYYIKGYFSFNDVIT